MSTLASRRLRAKEGTRRKPGRLSRPLPPGLDPGSGRAPGLGVEDSRRPGGAAGPAGVWTERHARLADELIKAEARGDVAAVERAILRILSDQDQAASVIQMLARACVLVAAGA